MRVSATGRDVQLPVAAGQVLPRGKSSPAYASTRPVACTGSSSIRGVTTRPSVPADAAAGAHAAAVLEVHWIGRREACPRAEVERLEDGDDARVQCRRRAVQRRSVRSRGR